MSDSTKIDIQELSDKLISTAKECCWNNFSNSYSYILSEIVDNELNLFEKRRRRKKQNSVKIPMNLNRASAALDKLYKDLYDVNFYVYKADSKKTIIEIQYFLKPSLDKAFFEKVKDNKPMLHCKVPIPFYLKKEGDKFDVNWELLGLRYKWNVFVHKLRTRNHGSL